MKHRIAAEIPRELAEEARRTIIQLRASADPEEHRDEGADLVLRLTEAGLDAFFLAPVRALGVGLVAEQAAALGVKASYRAIALFVRRIAGGLSGEQMLVLADILEEMVIGGRTSAGTGNAG